MAKPEPNTLYNNYGSNRTLYTRESSATGWFVAIIVVLSLLAIGYLIFSDPRGGIISATKYPLVFTSLLDATVVSTEESTITLKQTDGTCVALESQTYSEMWYQLVECPGATNAVATPAS